MKVNIFSEQNEGAEALAADLQKHNGETCIFPENGGYDGLKEAVSSVSRPDELRIFLISSDERENLQYALMLHKSPDLFNGLDACIYVFSSSDVTRTILDSLDFGNVQLRLVDPVETAVWNLMAEHPLYETRDRLGDEELRVLIIGSGAAVPTIVKTVYWCGRMRLFRMKMNMIGGDMAHLETEMKFRCPGLFTQTMQENLDMRERGLVVPELYLPLRLTRAHYFQAETDTEEFEIALNKCLDSNYIIIDEGDDEATLRTAMAVRAHFIRKHILDENFLTGGRVDATEMPDIFVLISDDRISEAVPELTVEGHPADYGNNDALSLVPFGSVKSVYKAENITENPLDSLAEALFPDEFNGENSMPPSIRRMLRASALHLKYKLRDMNMIQRGYRPEIYNEDNFPQMHDVSMYKADEIQQNFKFEMTALEHQCWVVFRLTDGWIPADAYHALGYGRLYEDGHREHRQFAGKMSAACVESSALSGTGTKLYGSPSYFTEYDRKTAAKTCEAIKSVYPETEFAALIDMDFDD